MSATEIITNFLQKEGKSDLEISDLIEEIYCQDLGESLIQWAEEIESENKTCAP